jgi:type II secretory pathway component PulF
VKFSSKNLATFYYQLGTLVQAGLPIQSAMTSLAQTSQRTMRKAVIRLSEFVNSGVPLHEAMEQSGRTFAPLDRHAIDMGERSGTLDVALLSLSKYYENRSSARQKLISGSLYPAFMLVASVFITHFSALFLGTQGGKPYTIFNYLWDTVGFLGGLVLIFWLARMALNWSLSTPGLNLIVDRVLKAIPVVGRLRFDYALSQWISSIRLMLTAGIGVVPALEYASRSAHSPLIASAYEKAVPLIGSGLQVSQALAFTRAFPEEVIQFWTTGEQSGRMDEMLERLASFYEDRWRRSLDHVVTWLPRFAYFLVVIYVVSQIFNGFNSYMSQYDELLK